MMLTNYPASTVLITQWTLVETSNKAYTWKKREKVASRRVVPVSEADQQLKKRIGNRREESEEGD